MKKLLIALGLITILIVIGVAIILGSTNQNTNRSSEFCDILNNTGEGIREGINIYMKDGVCIIEQPNYTDIYLTTCIEGYDIISILYKTNNNTDIEKKLPASCELERVEE